ncbi:MAG: methylenetetrahydrofolate reductase [Rhizobium sp.]|nr:MAG: methylenetetrahydrofolate reductase [Rhizobium sp.]
MTSFLSADTRPLPASIEILPKQIPTVDELKSLIPAGTRVYLTDIGTADTEHEMMAAARRLRDCDLVPVPHLAARRIGGGDVLERRISALVHEAGVTDVLVIGGGISPPRGPYASSMDLLRTGYLDRFGITDIAVAGHPEGSPDFTEALAFEVLHEKQAFARLTGARLRIVTQFGFDPAKAMVWAKGLSEIGISAPVHIGVAGPAKLTTLVKYGTLCGVGNSMSMLTKHSGSLMALATGYSPDTFVKPIEAAQRNLEDVLIFQMHIFPFGGLAKAATWLRSRGSW